MYRTVMQKTYPLSTAPHIVTMQPHTRPRPGHMAAMTAAQVARHAYLNLSPAYGAEMGADSQSTWQTPLQTPLPTPLPRLLFRLLSSLIPRLILRLVLVWPSTQSSSGPVLSAHGPHPSHHEALNARWWVSDRVADGTVHHSSTRSSLSHANVSAHVYSGGWGSRSALVVLVPYILTCMRIR